MQHQAVNMGQASPHTCRRRDAVGCSRHSISDCLLRGRHCAQCTAYTLAVLQVVLCIEGGLPSIGRPRLLLLVDGNLPQQGHSLTVPVQYERVVGGHNRVVSLSDGLRAAKACQKQIVPVQQDWSN